MEQVLRVTIHPNRAASQLGPSLRKLLWTSPKPLLCQIPYQTLCRVQSHCQTQRLRKRPRTWDRQASILPSHLMTLCRTNPTQQASLGQATTWRRIYTSQLQVDSSTHKVWGYLRTCPMLITSSRSQITKHCHAMVHGAACHLALVNTKPSMPLLQIRPQPPRGSRPTFRQTPFRRIQSHQRPVKVLRPGNIETNNNLWQQLPTTPPRRMRFRQRRH